MGFTLAITNKTLLYTLSPMAWPGNGSWSTTAGPAGVGPGLPPCPGVFWPGWWVPCWGVEWALGFWGLGPQALCVCQWQPASSGSSGLLSLARRRLPFPGSLPLSLMMGTRLFQMHAASVLPYFAGVVECSGSLGPGLPAAGFGGVLLLSLVRSPLHCVTKTHTRAHRLIYKHYCCWHCKIDCSTFYFQMLVGFDLFLYCCLFWVFFCCCVSLILFLPLVFDSCASMLPPTPLVALCLYVCAVSFF